MTLKKEVRKALNRVPAIRNWLKQKDQRSYIRDRNKRFPQMRWKSGPPCPQHRVEAARMQVGSKLFVFGGYVTLGSVSQRVDMLDLKTHHWEEIATLPDDAPQTHNGTAYDGENHIYLVSGQMGPNCSPASANCFAFDIRNYQWTKIPPLPDGRYMPLVHYTNGRIHCLSGTTPDRSGSANEHWSIAVSNGQSTESEWRTEAPLPSPRTHTASHIIGDELFIFGGQTGDVPAIEGSSEYFCNFNTPTDEVLDESYAFNLASGAVRTLQPMPIKLAHSEHAVLQIGSQMILAGGVLDRNHMSDLIFSYDLNNNIWSELGRLPYPMKSKIAAFYNDRLYIVTGQRSVSEVNLRPNKVLDEVWHTALPKAT